MPDSASRQRLEGASFFLPFLSTIPSLLGMDLGLVTSLWQDGYSLSEQHVLPQRRSKKKGVCCLSVFTYKSEENLLRRPQHM